MKKTDFKCPKCDSGKLIRSNLTLLRWIDCNYSWFLDNKKKSKRKSFDLDLLFYKFNKKKIYLIIGSLIFIFIIWNQGGFNKVSLEYISNKIIDLLSFLGFIAIGAVVFKLILISRRCPNCHANSRQLVDQQWHGTTHYGARDGETRNIYKNTYECSKCGNQWWEAERSWFF